MSAGRKLFLPNTEVENHEEMFVESLARIANSAFERSTLRTLEEMVWMRTESGTKTLKELRGDLSVTGVCDRKTQGLFFAAPGGGDRFWGYTRSGQWIKSRSSMIRSDKPVYSVVTSFSTIREIVTDLKVEPMSIAGRFEAEMEHIADRRRSSLKEAEDASSDMKAEKNLYYLFLRLKEEV